MGDDDRLKKAQELYLKAYESQSEGDFEEAERLYLASIEELATAEAHTFLGWTYSTMGRNEKAIEECQKAILIDPDFGNPYNDIGAYLIELERVDDAIPWLERALNAKRYEARHVPLFNLARVFEQKNMYNRAMDYLRKCLEMDDQFQPAWDLMSRIRRLVN